MTIATKDYTVGVFNGKTVYKFRLNRFEFCEILPEIKPGNVDDHFFAKGVEELDASVGICFKPSADFTADFGIKIITLSPYDNLHKSLFKDLVALYRQERHPDCIEVALNEEGRIVDYRGVLPKDPYKKPERDYKEYEGFLNFGIF